MCDVMVDTTMTSKQSYDLVNFDVVVNTSARAEFYESGIDPSSFISKGGANILC